MDVDSTVVNNGVNYGFNLLAMTENPVLFPEGAFVFVNRNSNEIIEKGHNAYNAGNYSTWMPSANALTVADFNLRLKNRFVASYEDVLALYNAWSLYGVCVSPKKLTNNKYELHIINFGEASNVLDYFGAPNSSEEHAFCFVLHEVTEGVNMGQLYPQITTVKAPQHMEYPVIKRLLLTEEKAPKAWKDRLAKYPTLAGAISPVYRALVPSTQTDRVSKTDGTVPQHLFLSTGVVSEDVQKYSDPNKLKMAKIKGKPPLNL